MGLSTHVLDTMHGTPAAGMQVVLYETHGDVATPAKHIAQRRQRNPDGPLYGDGELKAGTYRLSFDVGGYFRARGVQLPEPPFLNQVQLDFGVADPSQHYHVPLLVGPCDYSTRTGGRDRAAARGRWQAFPSLRGAMPEAGTNPSSAFAGLACSAAFRWPDPLATYCAPFLPPCRVRL